MILYPKYIIQQAKHKQCNLTSYYLASTIKQAPVNDVVLCVNTSEQLTIETLYRMPSNHLLKYQIEFSNVKAKFNLHRVDLCGANFGVAYPQECCRKTEE